MTRWPALIYFGLWASSAASDAPLSAIEWLSETVVEPEGVLQGSEAPVTAGVETPSVSVAALTPENARTVGIARPESKGLPPNLWRGSDTQSLITLINAQPTNSVPSLQRLLHDLLVLEAQAPLAQEDAEAFLIARLDKLLDLGAIDQAQRLIEVSDSNSSQIFRRAFDIALLTGTEDLMCDQLRRTPDIAPTFPARIFCLARGGDWTAAALTLETAEALGLISDEDDILFARFLEPELNDGADPLPPPSAVTPLIFRVREAIGEYVPTQGLPIAFAHADLRSTVGWKAQLEAAERLTANGSMSPEDFATIYMQRQPAASGGVWDRVAPFQRLTRAIEAGDISGIERALPPTWEAMQAAGTEAAFSALYADTLKTTDLNAEGQQIADLMALMTRTPGESVETRSNAPQIAFLQSLTTGRPRTLSDDPLEVAIRAAFFARGLPSDFRTLRRASQQGEALLKAIKYFAEGLEGDRQRLTQSLQALRALGYEDIAISAAIEAMIQNERPS